MASITQRLLFPVSKVSAGNAWHNDPFCVLNTKENALQIMSRAAYANEINKAVICEFEMNFKKYFYWRSNISHHSKGTRSHYGEKFLSLIVNTIRFPFLVLISQLQLWLF